MTMYFGDTHTSGRVDFDVLEHQFPREWEREFYRTCLQKPFNTNSNGFGELREIRDLYAHGYGVPVTREAQERLAARLHSKFDFSPPSATEIALGYSGAASFFGETATYDAKEGLRDLLMMRLPAANLTPVATHRALDRLRTHVHRAVEAVRGGIRDDYRQSKYIRTVVRWWEKNGGTPED